MADDMIHPTEPAREARETYTPTVVTCKCGAVIHEGDGHLCPDEVEHLRNLAAPCCELDGDGDGNCPVHHDYQPRPTGAGETAEAEAREYLAELDTRAARGPLSPENEHVRIQMRDALDAPSPTGAGEGDDALLAQCLKPEEIAGPNREGRIDELLRWFVRYAQGAANPKWLHGHAFEMAYALCTARTEAARLEREREEAQLRAHGAELTVERLEREGERVREMFQRLREALGVSYPTAEEVTAAALDRIARLAARDAELAGVREECDLLRRALRRVNPLVAGWSLPELRERYGAQEGRCPRA